MNIILAGTGSVAAIKYWRLFKDLQDIGTVKGILTDKGAYFASTALSENKDLFNIAESIVNDIIVNLIRFENCGREI